MNFFARLLQSIDHDQTFQRVWNKTQSLVGDAEDLTFEEALDTVMEKEKSLIYQAFGNVKGEECESSDTNVWFLILQETEDNNVNVFGNF